MTLARISAEAASSEGATTSAESSALLTLFWFRRELLVRTATGIDVIFLISLMSLPSAVFKVGSPEPEKVM